MSKHAKQVRQGVLAASFLCATAATVTILAGADRNGPPAPSRSGAQQELLLVRAWNPITGELIGWMPLHSVAITLQAIGGGRPDFELNQAVAVDFPYRPDASPSSGGVEVVLETATFRGRKWIPAESAPNVVRIHKFTFCVKLIEFGESKWRSRQQ